MNRDESVKKSMKFYLTKNTKSDIFYLISEKKIMSSISSLKEREIAGLSFSGEVKLAKFHDDVYIFVTNDEKLITFDIVTLQKITYDPPDKTIKSSITALALSPEHDTIALGFLDGSIQTYEYGNPKPGRVLSKARKGGSILAMQFINQSTLIFFDTSNQIFTYNTQLSVQNLFKSLAKEQPVAALANAGILINIPPIYRNTSSSTPKPSAKCTMPFFQSSFFISTIGNAILAQYIEDKFIPLTVFNVGGSMADFIAKDEMTLLIAIYANSELNLYSLTYKAEPVLLKTIAIEESCQNLFFINQKMICLMTSDNQYIYIMLEDGSKSTYKAGHEGLAISSYNSFSVLTDSKIYQYFLPTFQDSFEVCQNSSNLEGAQTLCKKAIDGDVSASLGLPTNPSQRFLVVQQSFMGFFDQYIREKVAENANSEPYLKKLIDQSISISEEMHCSEWITTKLLQIYKDEDKLQVYFKHILELDPNAQKFFYTEDFVNDLILQKANKELFAFIEQLPETIAPSALILKFAIDNKEYDLAVDIYFNRIQDIISGLTLLFDVQKYQDICEKYLVKYIQVQNSDADMFHTTVNVIKWLFAFSKEQTTFPRLLKLVQANQSNKLDILDTIYAFIKEYQTPFNLDIYFNSLMILYLSLQAKESFKNPIFILTNRILLENDVKLSKQSIQLILKFCFSNIILEPDTREKTLITLMDRHYLDQMMDQLLPMCEGMKFRTAKSEIMVKAKKFDIAIQEMLLDQSTDVYGFINKVIKDDFENAEGALKTAIENNTALLLLRDPLQFYLLINKIFPDMLIPVIQLIGDRKLQNLFLREVFSSASTCPTAEFSNEILQQYFEFISTYYPQDVLPFLQSKLNLSLTDFTKRCRENRIFDALVYIDEETGNISDFEKDFVDLITESSFRYIDGDILTDNAKQLFDFAIEMLRQYIQKFSKDPSIPNILRESIKSIAISLYMVKDLPDTKEEGSQQTIKEEKRALLKDLFLKIVNISTKHIEFAELLKFLLEELGEIRFGEAREVLMSVIRDFTYDIDSENALAQLFTEDEYHAFENYMLSNGEGIQLQSAICGGCKKKLLSINSQIVVFKCGHCFHNNPSCLKSDKCPICENIVTAEDSTPPSRSINIAKKLRDFEYFIKVKPDNIQMNLYEPFNEDEPVEAPTATSLPF